MKPGFFLTANEHRSLLVDPLWQLAMVTGALSAPLVKFMNANDTLRHFSIVPYAFVARPLDSETS